ncbi:CbtB domain-containing protein [Arthrobacter sp. S2(2024)]|uniref:CbtB domain-containing protein n=1 Tax=Arthrobacter sp. S2(2024) TaxID=3111911 RepID=UPI002FC79425
MAIPPGTCCRRGAFWVIPSSRWWLWLPGCAAAACRSRRGSVLAVSASLVILYLIQFDAGQLSQSGMLPHEIMHDGRHLLGVPCH